MTTQDLTIVALIAALALAVAALLVAARLARRLKQVEDRAAIQDLAARYAWHVARGEGVEVSELFTEDGGFEGSGQALKGKANLRDFYATALKPQMVIPMVQNVLTDISGDEARGTCKIHSPWSPSGPGFCSWYQDSYRRGPKGWLFVHRKITDHQRPAA